MHDLAVALRIYPLISKNPIIHSNNKFELVKTSLMSFKTSLKGLQVFFYFILDGCPFEYKTLIRDIFKNDDYIIYETDSIGNLATFKKQIEILTTQNYSEIVYFAEDDYLYQPNLFYKLIDIVKSGNADFATCYAHNDLFTHPIHNHKRKVKYINDHFWMEANSTCLTFITKKSTLIKTQKIFLTYINGNNDCSIWLTLTKKHVLNPNSWFRFFNNKECIGIIKVAVKKSLFYYLTSPKYSLWVSYPAIGTHLEQHTESPGYDWIELANKLRK